MIVKVPSLAFLGINVTDVDVQVQIEPGIPKFTIVGLADKTIAESKERVRAALSSIGLSFPAKKILINLAPADLVKEGSHFDLAISIAIITAMGALPADSMIEYLTLGELSLDGSILPVNGILPAAMGAVERGKGIICAEKNGAEAAWSGNQNILAASNLLEIINHFKGSQILSPPKIQKSTITKNYPDLKDVRGQKIAKRALEIAAAGGHNLLMFGAPGTGKSMLASCLPGILPALSAKEILECSTIASISGFLNDANLTTERPYRAPHHSCSTAAMVGGGIGRKVKAGEISLAHCGVLFLDELPEFNNNVLESLRQPLETKEVLISRSGAHIKFPANFQLIAAMNPCKCGYLNEETRACSRAPICGLNYQAKISGPILDRFDLHLEIAKDKNYLHDQLLQVNNEEPSSIVKERVQQARLLQKQRYEGYDIDSNNSIDGQLLIDYAIPNDQGRELINQAAKKFNLSMRAYNRILRVARTIADLEDTKQVTKTHIAEALSYRQIEFKKLPLMA